MPFRSERQRKFLWSQHPDIARRWAAGEHSSSGNHKMPRAKRKGRSSRKSSRRTGRGGGTWSVTVAGRAEGNTGERVGRHRLVPKGSQSGFAEKPPARSSRGLFRVSVPDRGPAGALASRGQGGLVWQSTKTKFARTTAASRKARRTSCVRVRPKPTLSARTRT